MATATANVSSAVRHRQERALLCQVGAPGRIGEDGLAGLSVGAGALVTG